MITEQVDGKNPIDVCLETDGQNTCRFDIVNIVLEKSMVIVQMLVNAIP